MPRPDSRLLLLVLGLAAGTVCARDLSLAEVEQRVAQSNREVLAARRGVEAAAAGIRQADVAPNPMLSYSANSISSNPGIGAGSVGQKRIDNVLRIDQVLERGGKRELRVAAARDLESASKSDYDDMLRQQLLAARSAYVDLQQAQARESLLADTGDLYARTYAAAQARLKAGDLAASEVARVQVDYERALNDRRSAQADVVRARTALAYLIGEETAAPDLRAIDPWPSSGPSEAPSAAQIARYIENRPDVLSAKARIASADKLRDLARSERVRDVSVGAQFERYPGNLPVNSLGISVGVPLFVGNDFSGDIQRAEVDRYAAQDALERARAVARTEIVRAQSDLRALAARLARYQGSLLAAAQRSADAAEFAFKRGATSVLEVLDARRSLRSVQLEALATRADYARALYAFRAAVQAATPTTSAATR